LAYVRGDTMLLDLREIIGVPGGRVAFDYSPDLSEAISESIVMVKQPSRAAGNVSNKAGILTFSANVDADCVCVCARCLEEFDYPVRQQISVLLTEKGEDGGNPDGYFLQGDKIDAGEIIITEFILGLEERILCRPDCLGLCENCGCDLNTEQCSCKIAIDPRLAVLEQLLDNQIN